MYMNLIWGTIRWFVQNLQLQNGIVCRHELLSKLREMLVEEYLRLVVQLSHNSATPQPRPCRLSASCYRDVTNYVIFSQVACQL